MIWWALGVYAAGAVVTFLIWVSYGDKYNNTRFEKSWNYCFASVILWPLHLMWTVLCGVPEIIEIKRGPVKLTRRQERDMLLEDEKNRRLRERNAIQREYHSLTGQPTPVELLEK